MNQRPTSFYYSFLVLPPEKRAAIVAVWDFCRAVDDSVDEAAEPEARAAVERWRREVSALFEGHPETAEGRALLPVLERFHLSRDPFDALVEGVAMDLDTRRYETFEALRLYCLRVASAVGLMCVEIFGYRDLLTRDYAIDLGIALQLTNILRDVKSDLARDRIYIPLEDMRRFDCTEEDLRAGVMNDRLHALFTFETERARAYYRKAETELPKKGARGLMAARIMGAIYFDVLRAIERSGYDVFHAPIRLSRPRQMFLAAVTWLRFTLSIA